MAEDKDKKVNPALIPLFATGGNGASYWSTLTNVMPSVFKSTGKYPAGLARWASKHLGTKDDPAKGQFGVGLGFKLGLQGAGALALVYAARRLRDALVGEDPARKLDEQLDSTYEPDMGKTAAEGEAEPPDNRHFAVGRPGPGSWENLAVSAGPALAILGMGALGWHLAGRHIKADSREYLKNELAEQEEEYNRLLHARARLAKGNLTQRELRNVLRKSASLDKSALANEVIGAIALLASGLYVGSSVAAYNYFRKSDPDNLKLEAMEKGLKEYSKVRSDMTPVSIVPKNSDEFFRKIDEGRPKASAAPELDYAASKRLRVAPEVEDARRGVSVSL